MACMPFQLHTTRHPTADKTTILGITSRSDEVDHPVHPNSQSQPMPGRRTARAVDLRVHLTLGLGMICEIVA